MSVTTVALESTTAHQNHSKAEHSQKDPDDQESKALQEYLLELLLELQCYFH